MSEPLKPSDALTLTALYLVAVVGLLAGSLFALRALVRFLLS